MSEFGLGGTFEAFTWLCLSNCGSPPKLLGLPLHKSTLLSDKVALAVGLSHDIAKWAVSLV
jgi:hypothetical protein